MNQAHWIPRKSFSFWSLIRWKRSLLNGRKHHWPCKYPSNQDHYFCQKHFWIDVFNSTWTYSSILVTPLILLSMNSLYRSKSCSWNQRLLPNVNSSVCNHRKKSTERPSETTYCNKYKFSCDTGHMNVVRRLQIEISPVSERPNYLPGTKIWHFLWFTIRFEKDFDVSITTWTTVESFLQSYFKPKKMSDFRPR